MKIFTKIICLIILATSLLSLNLPATAQLYINDIAEHQFEYEIKTLHQLNILSPYPDGTFRPDLNINRADTAVWLVKALDLPMEDPPVSPFYDVPTSHFAYRYIATAYHHGIMEATSDGYFSPGDPLTRTDLAIILGKVKGLEEEVSEITEPLILSIDEGSVPPEAMGYVTLGLKPEHQFLSYRNRDGYRVFAPQEPASRAEVAYGIHQVLYPPRTGDTVVVALTHEPKTLNNWVSARWASTQVVWDSLGFPSIGRDENWALYPGYLKEIPSIDNGLLTVSETAMHITYIIREGLKYHDGVTATIDDWAYSFMVFMDPMTPIEGRFIEDKIDLTKGTGKYGLKGFDILDDYSVKVYFQELDWRATLAMPGRGLYPKHIVQGPFEAMKSSGDADLFRNDPTMSRNPIGLGPYKIVSWTSGSQLTLTANPYFFLGRPLINNLTFRIITDPTNLLNQIRTGLVDVVVFGLDLIQGMQLASEGHGHLKVNFTDSFSWEHIGFNLDNPILSDLRVRKALILGMNREALVQSMFQGKQKVAHGYYHPRHWGYDEVSTVKYDYNPVEANRLLEEAGWLTGADGFRYKDGVKLELILQTTADRILRAEVQAILKAQLQQIGVDLDITKNLPATQFFSQDFFYGRQWTDMIMFAWVISPDSTGETIFSEQWIPSASNNWSGQNIYGWRNLEATNLLTQANKEMNEEVRSSMIKRVGHLITAELPVIPLYWRAGINTNKINLASVRSMELRSMEMSGYYINWNCYYWYWR